MLSAKWVSCTMSLYSDLSGTHTASLWSSRSFSILVWVEFTLWSLQSSPSAALTMWSLVLQPCTETQAHTETWGKLKGHPSVTAYSKWTKQTVGMEEGSNRRTLWLQQGYRPMPCHLWSAPIPGYTTASVWYLHWPNSVHRKACKRNTTYFYWTY